MFSTAKKFPNTTVVKGEQLWVMVPRPEKRRGFMFKCVRSCGPKEESFNPDNYENGIAQPAAKRRNQVVYGDGPVPTPAPAVKKAKNQVVGSKPVPTPPAGQRGNHQAVYGNGPVPTPTPAVKRGNNQVVGNGPVPTPAPAGKRGNNVKK